MHKVDFNTLEKELAPLGFQRQSGDYLWSENLTVYSTGSFLHFQGPGIVTMTLLTSALTNGAVLDMIDLLLGMKS